MAKANTSVPICSLPVPGFRPSQEPAVTFLTELHKGHHKEC